MIRLHRLNGEIVVVNTELVESVLAVPDTVILMATGNRIVVKESVEEVIQRAVAYRQAVNQDSSSCLPEFLRSPTGDRAVTNKEIGTVRPPSGDRAGTYENGGTVRGEGGRNKS